MKLLLIMPKFFNYPELIIEELENMGYEVDFFDDRPSTNAWIKAIIRINKKLVNRYIKKYFDKMMETVKSKEYDIVFLISGQSLSFSESMIKEIRNLQSKSKFVLYQWDSQHNFPYIEKFQKYFDKCYSFDRKDVKDNQSLKFLPLFYSKAYEAIGKRNNKKYKYDFCFVGTAHPKKYQAIKMMSNQLKKVFPNQFIYFFFPSPIVYFYRKIMNKELRKARYNDFHYIPLIKEEFNKVYESSRCVLDSAQAGQIGLTIRVLESIGAKKKLITTNEDVVNYDFYKAENIYVYKGAFDLNNVFFKSEYKEISENIYKKYSLKSWLRQIVD